MSGDSCRARRRTISGSRHARKRALFRQGTANTGPVRPGKPGTLVWFSVSVASTLPVGGFAWQDMAKSPGNSAAASGAGVVHTLPLKTPGPALIARTCWGRFAEYPATR
jgi:hypothetical protein